MTRKELKKNGKKTMRQHYLLTVFLCLLIGMLGLSYTSSLSSIKEVVKGTDIKTLAEEKIAVKEETEKESKNEQILSLLIMGKWEEGLLSANENHETISKEERKLGKISIGHSRGVLSQLVTVASSGELLTMVWEAIHTMTHSSELAIVLLVIGSMLLVYSVRFFVFEVFYVTVKRIFMEARIYEKIPNRRFMFFLQIRKIGHVALTMLLEMVFYFLWSLTIIGGFIKSYSYKLVPYILAENPNMGAKETITLSRAMMNGHKWECFVLNISFIGWDILDFITFGLVGIFFSNPYQEATMAEYYAYIRKSAIERNIPGSEYLNDRYLYEKADEATLQDAYADIMAVRENQEELPEIELHAIRRWIREIFGVCLTYDKAEKIYQEKIVREEVQKEQDAVMEGKQYPSRLFIIPQKEKIKRIEYLNYLRHYSVTSLILIFFSFCMVGWLWEVSLHLISDGEFVNRGVLHGPWLPIYGSGGILILVVLNKLRKYPLVEFVSAIVVCGILEYTTGWYLEITHNGQKWWDYSGYFLNIDGRVCAEGLLIFGIGGMAIVYLLAPHLDNLFRKIPMKIVVPICAILLTCYIGDQIYSKKHPNAGEGITSVSIENYSEVWKC